MDTVQIRSQGLPIGKNTHSGKPFPLSSLLLIIAVVIGVSAWLVIKIKTASNDTPSSSIVPAVSPLTAIPQKLTTSGWPQFMSNTYQYKIKLPVDWELVQGGLENSRLEFSKARIASLLLTIGHTSHASISSYLHELDTISQTAYEGSASAAVETREILTQDGDDVIVRQEYLLAADMQVLSLYSIKNGLAYVLRMRPLASNKLADEQMLLGQQIFSTFHFLNDFEMLKWPEFKQEDTGVTFYYPARLTLTPDAFDKTSTLTFLGKTAADRFTLSFMPFTGDAQELVALAVSGGTSFPLYQVSIIDTAEALNILGNEALRFRGKGGDTLVFFVSGTRGYLFYTSIKDQKEVNLILTGFGKFSSEEEGMCVAAVCPSVTQGCSWKMTLDRCKCGELLCDE